MTDGAALSDDIPALVGEAAAARAVARAPCRLAVEATHRLAEVEAIWRGLMATGGESPGQSFDFVRLWIAALQIPEADQYYVVGFDGTVPVALLPLHRHWTKGIRTLSWFPGSHVGCNAPIVDRGRLAAMTEAERSALWTQMLRTVSGADVMALRAVPHTVVEGIDIFAELGSWLEVETLYRAEFGSWEEANTTQRSKSRRKHDRQQGEKLEALGTVDFAEIGNGPEAASVLDIMFRQRAARFREMGVADPFAPAEIRRFYDSSVEADSGIRVRLHLLKLNGEIVAVRYNVADGDRLFCLISSMSTEPALQPGSPGKQCLLKVMQTVFDAGYRMFDMGAGFTDEKRHWCNVQIGVRQHYLPITRRGALAVEMHRQWQVLRHRIKSDERLLRLAKSARGTLLKLTGRGAVAAPPPPPAAD